MKVHETIFDRLIAPENLFAAWEGFRKNKARRHDVAAFAWRLEEHVFALHGDLRSGRYRHGPYATYSVCDPKQRRIHKATVRDRLLHHAIVRVLDSFSCRRGKGTHRAVEALHRMLRRVSRNGARPCFALQFDVRRFFASVDHRVLLGVLGRTVRDADAMRLLAAVVGSHTSAFAPAPVGLPLGNLTSQLFANVYLNELDQFVKHGLRVRSYVRYADDVAIVSADAESLRRLLLPVEDFLSRRLRLRLHPSKIRIRKYRQGIDFLGYVLLPHHRVVRTTTKRRMLRRLETRFRECKAGRRPLDSAAHSLGSYLGVLSHAHSFRLGQDVLDRCQGWLAD
jgi:RNA-directed DNA polymerase